MRAYRRGLLGCMAVAAGMLFVASPASALSKHVFSGSFSGGGATALTNPSDVVFDPTSGDVYVSNTPEDNRQSVEVDATGGSFTLNFDGQTTAPIAVVPNGGIVGERIQKSLEALSAVGAGNLQVFNEREPLRFIIIFEGARADAELPPLTADDSGLTGGTATVRIATQNHGAGAADIEKFTPSGEFVLIAGKDVNRTKIEQSGASEAERNLCTAASGDTCQPGTPGSTLGAFDGALRMAQGGLGNQSQHYFFHSAHHLYLAVDPSSGDLYVGDPGAGEVTKLDPQGNLVTGWGDGGRQNGSGLAAGTLFKGGAGDIGSVSVRPDGTLLVLLGEITEFSSGRIIRLAPDGTYLNLEESTRLSPEVHDPETLEVSGSAVDPLTHERYFIEDFHYDDPMVVTHDAASGSLFEEFGNGELVMPQSVALNPSSGEVFVADSGNRRIAIFAGVPYLPDAIPAATALTPHSERLEGEAKRAGASPITACHFEYGQTSSYGSGPIACAPGASGGSPFTEATTHVSAELTALEYATAYHFRLVLENENGETSSYDDTFTTLPLAPTIESVTGQAFAETAVFHALINPGGGHTTYQVQFVTQGHFASEGFENASSTGELDAGAARSAQQVTAHLSGLTPNTTYHYRVVATNADETVKSPEHLFTTLPFVSEPPEECTNSHVRQQTSASQLLDCRAYELVSASHAAGYDVESNVIPGQSPFAGYPDAQGRVLYAVHSGGIPGTNHPTNRGLDPYIAVRGEEGWSTEYVGVPANVPFSAAPFSSTPTGADANLRTLAFGAPGGCSPCFADGSTGIPVHLANGNLVQGMASSEVSPPGSSFTSDGYIASDLSANGEHLVFSSTTLFAPGGNDGTGDVSIYDRNLSTGATHVVSNSPSGGPLACLPTAGACHSPGDGNGIAELDLSADGSHVLIGQKLTEDSAHNPYYHLYMDVNDSSQTIDLTPGTTSGVLYAGMSADGSKVYFTTRDRLTGEDTDTSADLYEAEVGTGAASLSLVSSGSEGTGNSDSCDPAANSVREHWNATGSQVDCSVVALGGGGGVASTDGAVYFLSPEQLAGSGHGAHNAPNLYLSRPGQAPQFVATLESSANAPLPPTVRHFQRSFGKFETPTGVAVSEAPGEAGDTYVLDLTNQEAQGNVRKYDPAGNLVTSFGTAGKINGKSATSPAFEGIPSASLATEMAVDNDPASSSYRDIYVANIYEEIVEKYSPSGVYEGSLPGGFPSGVAVNQATGEVYVSDLGGGDVRVFSDEGTELRSFPTIAGPTGVAVAPDGTVYVVNGGGFAGEPGETEAYDASGTPLRSFAAHKSLGVAVDPETEDVYIDEGSQVVEFDAAGNQVGTPTGNGSLTGSIGLAAYAGELYVSSRGPGPATGEVDVFGPGVLPPDRAVDNSLVVDSVSAPETRHSADFETDPSGEQAVFPSVLPLAENGEEAANHTEVFRYDAPSGKLACVSCTLSGFPPSGDSSLAANGLSLSDGGRVFFNSGEPLLASDTDETQDVYEWEPAGSGNCQASNPTFIRGACLSLVSAGTSTFDSGLLSATSDGKDAYFFTRDSLAPQDENGPTMKIYDAREGGGFPFLLPQAGCRASDECHGAASPPPPPIQSGTESGTPHNVEAQPKPGKCGKGKVRHHGACVRKPRKPHHHKHRKRGRQ